MYDAKVLADSISPGGVRLMTVEVTFPRFILAEVNTHRVFSRNSASSRAIPTERIIERVEKEPFIPATFNYRVKGMGVGEAVTVEQQAQSESEWLYARNAAVAHAKRLMEIGVDKSRVNRLLEPFMWHTAIISSTEWDNFFALRDHEAAQPEFRILAGLMLDCMRASDPRAMVDEWWHLPLVTEEEYNNCVYGKVNWEYMAMVSAGRCARVSFDRAHEYEHPAESHGRAQKLKESGHMSPFEHPAKPWSRNLDTGNFYGWRQLRKTIAGEDNFGVVTGRTSWEHP